jgi:hypothetical protein
MNCAQRVIENYRLPIPHYKIPITNYQWVHLQENISVGAKHDRNEYEIITNNLYPVMLRPLQKPDAPLPLPITNYHYQLPITPN